VELTSRIGDGGLCPPKKCLKPLTYINSIHIMKEEIIIGGL